MICSHCGGEKLRFLRPMTNVDKYFCKTCKKHTFIAKADSTGRPGRLRSFPARMIPEGKKGFYVFNHQGKANRLLDALNHGGDYYMLDSTNYRGISFVMSDTDILGRRHKLDAMRKQGVGCFFIYPHAGRPDVVNDIFREWAWTTAHFVSAQGHVDVMRAFGYSRPLEVIGWSLCPVREYRPREHPRNVLFAPIHPRCSEVDQDVNRGAFERLAALAYADDIKLTVRFVKDLGQSGLTKVEHPNIKYTVGFMNNMYDQIDGSDFVVAHQTFLHLAVARGVPAAAMAEDMPTHIQMRRKPVLWAKSWKKYEHLLAYPYDIMQCQTKGETLSLLRRAVRDDEEIQDWRKRMIGSPFRRGRFLKKVEKYL